MKRFLAFFLCFAPLGMPSAIADQDPVLIELFASQNCQACPKAHETLQSVAEENEDILILTWSVDYWDYLGDADPMAMPEAKARQAGYADQMNLRAPYTPQSVYDGVKQCPATRRRTVDRNIRERREENISRASLLTRAGDEVRVAHSCATPLEVLQVEYLTAGNHETAMVNPVTSARSLGSCTVGKKAFQVSCTGSCAIILQEPNYGEVKSALVFQ